MGEVVCLAEARRRLRPGVVVPFDLERAVRAHPVSSRVPAGELAERVRRLVERSRGTEGVSVRWTATEF